MAELPDVETLKRRPDATAPPHRTDDVHVRERRALQGRRRTACERPRGGALALALTLGLALLAGAPLRAQEPAPSSWWEEIDRVDGLLREGRWKKAERAHGRLRREVLLTSWRAPDLGRLLAELAFQAAVVHAQREEDDDAVWEWHTAQAFERVAGPARGGTPVTERDLTPYGRAADLLPAHRLRARGEPPAGEEAVEASPVMEFEPEVAPEYAQVETGNANLRYERPPPATYEVYVDREGRIRQPVIVSSWTPPVLLQWGLESLRRTGRFQPARLDGEPVGVLREIELSVEPPSRF